MRLSKPAKYVYIYFHCIIIGRYTDYQHNIDIVVFILACKFCNHNSIKCGLAIKIIATIAQQIAHSMVYIIIYMAYTIIIQNQNDVPKMLINIEKFLWRCELHLLCL